MIQTLWEFPGDDIARVVVSRVAGDWQRLMLSSKEGLQIGNASMVDITIRMAKMPLVGIGAEVSEHILVYRLLQIDTGGAECPYHNIGTDPPIDRHIAVGIGERNIRRVILRRLPGL